MNKRSNQPQKVNTGQQGFTLSELIIVVAILGILSTFIVLTFTRNANEEKLILASQSILQYLKSAQIRSQKEITPCHVVIDHTRLELSIDNTQNIQNNQDECQNIPTVKLKETIKGYKPDDLKICGTSEISNTSMACDKSSDGSDLNNTGQTKTETTMTFTPRGTVSAGGLLKLYSEKAERTRCIAVTTPLGLIRQGRPNNNDCTFNNL